MKRLLFIFLVFISVQAIGQNPTNYAWYKQRTRQTSIMIDSTFYVPRYCGAPTIRVNETSTIDGAIALDTCNSRFYIYSGGSWLKVANYTEMVDSIWRVAGTDSIFWRRDGTTYKIKDSTGGSSSLPISSLTAATATNTIDNTSYGQTWQWNSLTNGNALILSTNNGSSGSGKVILNLSSSGSNTGSNRVSTGLQMDITNTGSSSTNYGINVTVANATTSYGAYIDASGTTTAIGAKIIAGSASTNIALDLGLSGSSSGNMRMNGSTSGSITIQPAAAAGTYTLTLPTTDGNSGEFLQTDGSGALTWAAASGGGSPAGNFGNLQINRNGAFATPGSDSLDFESATGLTVKGGIRGTTLGVNTTAPTSTYAADILSDGTYTTNLRLTNASTPTSFLTLNSVYGDVLTWGSLFKGSEILITQSDGLFGISQGANQILRFTRDDGTYAGRRVQFKQGADVASANNLTLGNDGNVFEITGTTQINLIANTNWQNGAEITLTFSSSVTVKNGQATSGSNITLKLAGAADFSATADDMLTLVLCEVGGTQAWREKSRSVN